MYTTKILYDLPSVPAKFEAEAMAALTAPDNKDITPNDLRPAYKHRKLYRNDQEFPSTRTIRHELSDEFKDWVRENIVDSWTEVSVSVTPASIGHTMGAHTDWTNEFRLIYVLQEGGADCQTIYYQEKGKPYFRPGREWLNIDNFDLLDVRERIQMPKGHWCLTNTQYLHGVENITEDRIAIHVGLLTDQNIKTTDVSIAQSTTV
jgi:hypothetical protein